MSAVDPPQPPKRPWFEPATIILMGAATLATAWSSFESSRWDAKSRDSMELAVKLDRRSLALQIDSRQIKGVHFNILSELIDAKFSGDKKRYDFYLNRLGDELKPAFEKWMADHPFETPGLSSHPLMDDYYQPRHQDEIESTRIGAEKAESQSRMAGGNAGAHLANTVILSAVLLFAGTARTFDQRKVRTTVFAFAVVLFLFSVTRMILLPIA